jgi:lipoyl(octanoyl) transferase
MMGVKVIDIDRGGDVTLHNPGQMVGYPIFNLSSYKEDLHWFLREIEQTIIDLTSVFGIESARVEGMTGVWVESKRKICAMGMHCSRWVTYHGFALNVNNNVGEFDYIVPCGIQDKGVTSIEVETGTVIEYNNVVNECIKSFEKHF